MVFIRRRRDGEDAKITKIRNYIINNREQLNEETIVELLRSTPQGVSLLGASVKIINISTNTIVKLISELSSDTQIIHMLNIIDDYSQCDNETMENLYKRIRDSQNKNSIMALNDQLFVAFINYSSSVLDDIAEVALYKNNLFKYIELYQNNIRKFSDSEIFRLLIKYYEIRNYNLLYHYGVPADILNIINKIESDEVKIQILKHFDFLDKLTVDQVISILNNSTNIDTMKPVLDGLKEQSIILYKFDYILDVLFDSKIISKKVKKYLLNYLKKEISNYLNISVETFEDYITENGITPKCFDYLFTNCEFEKIYKLTTNEQRNNFFSNNLLDKYLFEKYFEINDVSVRNIFINYIKNNKNKITIEKIDLIVPIFNRVSESNSTEIQHMRDSIISMLIETDNPFENLKYIEDIFIKNNLPVPSKLFLVFDKLHPNCSGFNFDGNISPILKAKSVKGREAVIFSDLLKAALGSNNRSVREYLNNIYKGNIIFKAINMNLRNIDELTPEEREILTIFVSHLNTLYNNTLESNINGKRNLTGDLIKDINELNQLFTKNGEIQKDLPDRIVRMFGYLAGFNTYQEMLDYMNERRANADKRNRRESDNFTLQKGDFIKGIGDVRYLGTILQNGSVAKEFLGDAATSDATPLDTDLSQIQIDGTLTEMISSTQANGYGPIWFVLKNDGKFNLTRTEDGDINENIRDLSKLEIFYTGALGKGHYGIRTGFASSDIDYILCANYDEKIALEIVMNGFYIPIIDKDTGKLLFSPNDYDIMRDKMMGLSHYDAASYKFSNNLSNSMVNEMVNTLDKNEQEVNRKRNIILQNISASLSKLGLKVKNKIDGDLTPGSVELIDIGSTGRNTNILGDGDFDFIMRLDQNIVISKEKLEQLKKTIIEGWSVKNEEIIGSGDFRLKNVNINGLDVPVDIDISFVTKTNKVLYSTDMCLKDRLETIKRQDPEKYPFVIANIQLAKNILKEFGCYKPNRGDKTQGGLGGAGVENWILQNGGSFYDACIDFLDKSRDKTFEQFIKEYKIWNFGENHLAEKRGLYLHNNFVVDNISEEGYNKMKQALMTFVNNYTVTDKQNLSR